MGDSMLVTGFFGLLGGVGGWVFHRTRQLSRPQEKLCMGIGVGIGFLAGQGFMYISDKYRIRKRQYVEEYMRRHPEQFPEKPVQKFKDKFLPWIPVR